MFVHNRIKPGKITRISRRFYECGSTAINLSASTAVRVAIRNANLYALILTILLQYMIEPIKRLINSTGGSKLSTLSFSLLPPISINAMQNVSFVP
jgi:hypothetical protein